MYLHFNEREEVFIEPLNGLAVVRRGDQFSKALSCKLVRTNLWLSEAAKRQPFPDIFS
jgi:hypothetical protein